MFVTGVCMGDIYTVYTSCVFSVHTWGVCMHSGYTRVEFGGVSVCGG